MSEEFHGYNQSTSHSLICSVLACVVLSSEHVETRNLSLTEPIKLQSVERWYASSFILGKQTHTKTRHANKKESE
jgi:hypothetical protein